MRFWRRRAEPSVEARAAIMRAHAEARRAADLRAHVQDVADRLDDHRKSNGFAELIEGIYLDEAQRRKE